MLQFAIFVLQTTKFIFSHTQLEGQTSKFLTKKMSCYTSLLQAFGADINHVIVEMIAMPKIEGSPC